MRFSSTSFGERSFFRFGFSLVEFDSAPVELSDNTKECLDAVKDQLAVAHAYVDAYTELFTKNEEGVAEMNRTAPFVWHLLQAALAEAAVMALTRVLDRAKVSGNHTMSICRLTKLAERDGLADDRLKRLKQAETDALIAGKRLREARNTQLAHSDAAKCHRPGDCGAVVEHEQPLHERIGFFFAPTAPR